MKRSPSFVTLTLALSEIDCPGANSVCTRLNSERHGSVANSLKAIRPLSRGRAVGAAFEVAVAVGDPPVGDREAVQHRKPVEPVAHPVTTAFGGGVPDLEASRARPQQRPGQPPRQLAGERQLVDRRLVLERLEAERGGGSSQSGGSHDHSP